MDTNNWGETSKGNWEASRRKGKGQGAKGDQPLRIDPVGSLRK